MILSADLVAPLEPVITREVTTDDLDHNDHMTVARFFEAQVASVRARLASTGITAEYATERRMGTVAGEHHLRYLAELRLGDRFSTRVRVLARSERAAHLMSFLVNETQQRIACTLEVVVVHISQETRRSTPFPEDVAAALDAHVAISDELDLDLPARLDWRG